MNAVLRQWVLSLLMLSLVTALLIRVGDVRSEEVLVPELTERLTDLTGTIGPARAGRIEAELSQFEEETGSQVAVLLVPTTRPEEIEQYSIRVVDQWALGRADFDDGVLLLIAKDDRKVRIEVGRGLEGAIPDAKAKRIIEELIVPAFRAGEFVTGIETGITALFALIRGENLPVPKTGGNGAPAVNTGAVLPILFFMVFAGGFVRNLIGALPGSLATGGLGFLGGWLLAGSVGLGLFLAVVGTMIAFMPACRGPGGYYGGGGFGGLGRGGGFGGGGFGGGGGGFGGGGASGGW